MSITVTEQTAPATPATDKVVVYAKAGGGLYIKNDAGEEIELPVTVTAGITAFAGGGQGSATELTATLNEVSTVATTADSVKLDAAVAGYTKRRTIVNNGANACDVFPASGDNLGAGVDTAASLAAGANITYASYDATNWFAVT